ncbi:hypothetical protein Agabi119p4_1040 [Agaricus bisporus var. burnettii]|uniref:Uncharacterized protein n=1 Tax=Agaricus bisporus var. burnettii TaxID=192524 RepID=A0A8H7FBP2_AGABI|nr:hypothetical protein Agabi119p4_1040 [Agaricus bisporus var. burnettii]
MDNDHSSPSSGLPPDAEARVLKATRKEGFFAGMTGGLASAVLGGKLYRLSRNKTIICGILSGVLSGYLFTQAFSSTALAQLRAEETRRREDVQQVSETDAVSHPNSSPQ